VASETFGLPGCMPYAHYLADGGIFDNLGIQKLALRVFWWVTFALGSH
jgi:hypothetical protein